MIDLPIANNDDVDLHPRILFYNNIQLVLSLLILGITNYFAYQIYFGNMDVGGLKTFIMVVLPVVSLIKFLDVYTWFLIRSLDPVKIEKASKIYMIPVPIDVILIFAFGIGIFAIFLRVVVWGNINPEQPYFDEHDPLFN